MTGNMIQKSKLTFLGTGTSQGVPIIGCDCPVCRSHDTKDKRLRASVLVDYCGLRILVDAGPDFRVQMLRERVRHLDAILLTHHHADHVGGLDDVRSLNYIDRRAAEIYCEDYVAEHLRGQYPYAFDEHKYPGAPEWHLHLIENKPFMVTASGEDKELVWVHDVGYHYKLPDGTLVPTDGKILDKATLAQDPDFSGQAANAEGSEAGIEIIPIRGYHDKLPVLGYRFGQIAYITDMSTLPKSEFPKLQGLEHVTLNTVSYHPHHSHFCLDEALSLADRIGAKHTWLTHLSHTFPKHRDFCKVLRKLCHERHIHSEVQPAYDGLVIE